MYLFIYLNFSLCVRCVRCFVCVISTKTTMLNRVQKSVLRSARSFASVSEPPVRLVRFYPHLYPAYTVALQRIRRFER